MTFFGASPKHVLNELRIKKKKSSLHFYKTLTYLLNHLDILGNSHQLFIEFIAIRIQLLFSQDFSVQ